MKALASEIVRKLSKRLKWIGIQVRELTGSSNAWGFKKYHSYTLIR